MEKRGYAERFHDQLKAQAQKAQPTEVTSGGLGAPELPLLVKKRGDRR